MFPQSLGSKVRKDTLNGWIQACISLYLSSLFLTAQITAHSTRVAATAFHTSAPLEDNSNSCHMCMLPPLVCSHSWVTYCLWRQLFANKFTMQFSILAEAYARSRVPAGISKPLDILFPGHVKKAKVSWSLVSSYTTCASLSPLIWPRSTILPHHLVQLFCIL